MNTLVTAAPLHQPHNCFLVRVGTMGSIGRFASDEPISLHRQDAVVCRSDRGLEHGVVLGPAAVVSMASVDGRVIRRFAPEDHLLWSHLELLGKQAQAACQQWLTAQGMDTTLIDVEPLLDGRTLFFHFLANVDPVVQSQLDQLVKIYEQQVRASRFARLLEDGCGPGCGTDAKSGGCGTAGKSCAICSVAKQCKSSRD